MVESPQNVKGSSKTALEQWQTVNRVVFPTDGDPTVLPLYVNWGVALSVQGATRISDAELVGGKKTSQSFDQASASGESSQLSGGNSALRDVKRRRATIPAGRRASFATYFNAFPASYWHQWTTVETVRLSLTLTGTANVDVYRSTARGTFNRINGDMGATGALQYDISLKKFGDGGWIWFEVEAGDAPVTLENAEWAVPVAAKTDTRPKKVSVAITTYNRPGDCVNQMERFLAAPDLLERLDQLIITDQGNKKVKDEAGYAAAAAKLGDQFRLVEQANLGGSGGFARGMYEGVKNKDTDYVMLLDDDVLVETEGILRAVNFADFTRKPTIVGGHMLNLYERSMLHSFGEHVNQYKFMWGPVNPDLEAFDFARHSLRQTPELHKRMDVDYNGWWMCLIPREIIEEIGLALPVFIKWDDAEYGLRAQKHGYPSISLPGAAVWHMPWTEKDDRLDWQAYFHQRNRWLVALLYSPYKRGGALPRLSFAADVKHLLSLQYSPVALRNWALRDILAGPQHLHATIGQRTADVRAFQKTFDDGKPLTAIEDYPEVVRRRPLRKGEEPKPPRGRARWVARAALAAVRQLRHVDKLAQQNPEERVAATDAQWWRLSQLDSALVSTADGTGVAWYKRDDKQFKSLLKESEELHLTIVRHWDELARTYKRAFPEFVSPQAWESTFERKL